MHPFSPAGRRSALERMGRECLDLLVIGGGITGCGLAREAVLHGLKVGLVERADFACGTSSRSSKLVHGGLRYLAQGDLRMVRESLRERQVLRRLAPHLVHPTRFVYPLYRGQTHWPVKAAFRLIDLLAGEERHQVISAGDVLERAPGLGLPVDGGIQYLDYITDDARLTLENALSAAEHGALVANHAPVVGLLAAKGRLEGARVCDALTGQAFEVRARVVVNATGPWAEETLGLAANPGGRKRILLSKGIHLLFAAARLPVTGALILRSPAGREGFAVRRWDSVYVGTTDVAHAGRPELAEADPAAMADLLGLTQACFPDLALGPPDVLATWAGLRPLIAQPGRPPRDTSRHDRIWRSPEGLITIAGGKLTTYRPMARRIMRHVLAALGRPRGARDLSAEVPLPGAAPAPGLESVPAAAAQRIAWLYGGRAAELLRYGAEDPAWLHPLAPGVPALRGEVRLAVEQEMACTLPDFMDRRSALLLFCHGDRLAAAGAAARIMGERLGWSEPECQAQLEAYRQLDAAHRGRG